MRALLPYLALYRRHRWLLTLGVVLAIVTLLASIGLLTLSGWFLSACSIVGVAGIYSFNYMLPAAGVRGGAITRTAGRYFERLVSHDATFRVLEHLRVQVFSKLIPLGPSGLAGFKQGELLNRLVADVDTLDHLYLRVISPLVAALVVILAVTFGLGFLDLTLALTLGAILLLTLLLLPPVFYRLGKPVGIALTVQRARYREQLTRWLHGQAELTLFNSSARWRQNMDEAESQWLEAQRKQSELGALSQALLMLITGLAVVTMLWMASASVGGNTHPGALIALFVFCAMASFEALAPVTAAFQHMGQVMASATRLSALTDGQPSVRFGGQDSTPLDTVTIELKDLCFTYPGQAQPALSQMSLSIAAGERVAILGKTGCGKSTLLQLLTRAWDADSGEISLNHHPLNRYSEAALRRSTSVVSQRLHLFSATLRDNLLLAAPDAADTVLEQTLADVELASLLEDDGLNAWLGEGGRQLSGGELRRLGLARAMLHGGSLLLLDEPTEGLDAGTERQILELIDTISANKTLLMVTHRLQGLAAFDRIVMMENGQVIEQGSHQELIEKRGRYYQLRQRA